MNNANMTIRSADSGWEYLLEIAGSSNRDQRQISLVRSYSWVEHALEACGLRRDNKIRTISQLLHSAQDKSLLPSEILLSKVKEAIDIRHKAAHVDSVPSSDQCILVVETLRDIWFALRKSQLTWPNATNIAHRISELPGIHSVNLYGSLARKETEPQDFDLLVFDDGRYSCQLDIADMAYLDRVKITNKSLELLGFIGVPIMYNLVKCRWIDLTILDGNLFGKNSEYTTEIASCQPDKYFFLNIASDIMQYDNYLNTFVVSDMDIFIRLRSISSMLKEIGIGTNR